MLGPGLKTLFQNIVYLEKQFTKAFKLIHFGLIGVNAIPLLNRGQ